MKKILIKFCLICSLFLFKNNHKLNAQNLFSEINESKIIIDDENYNSLSLEVSLPKKLVKKECLSYFKKFNNCVLIFIRDPNLQSVTQTLKQYKSKEFYKKGHDRLIKNYGIGAQIIKDLKIKGEKMIAGNITKDKLGNLSKLADIIDVSGALETNKVKDVSKIKKFMNKVKQINENTFTSTIRWRCQDRISGTSNFSYQRA